MAEVQLETEDFPFPIGDGAWIILRAPKVMSRAQFRRIRRFIDFFEELLVPEEEAHPEWTNESIEALGLSVRAMNCLEPNDVRTIGQLVRKTADQLLVFRTLGDYTLREIRGALANRGLALKGESIGSVPSASEAL